MNDISTINRDEIEYNAKIESDLLNYKQHAQKMIRDFEKFNNFFI
ncbi:Uncharacterised protein [Sphingobacterium spiritivorum]|uniref:Uncharacterized protein n=1 Tax=Sphingobacterium spiritivorum TaxID=258 RepID=A0A380BU85_SPHSI|nr:Uncharacterised protein [Sphingobacterium spiritivorum]